MNRKVKRPTQYFKTGGSPRFRQAGSESCLSGGAFARSAGAP
jgi:hypothetical protein